MFRKPREGADQAPATVNLPSVGRPPSPPTFTGIVHAARQARKTPMPTKTALPKLGTYNPPSRTVNGKTIPLKKPGLLSTTPKGKSNGSILNFFKKEEQGLFFEDSSDGFGLSASRSHISPAEDSAVHDVTTQSDPAVEPRYNENGGSNKRQRTDESGQMLDETSKGPAVFHECSPPPPTIEHKGKDTTEPTEVSCSVLAQPAPPERRNGPFADDSDSDDQEISPAPRRSRLSSPTPRNEQTITQVGISHEAEADSEPSHEVVARPAIQISIKSEQDDALRPQLKREATSFSLGAFDEFDALAEFDGEEDEEPEYYERRFMAEQRRLEMAEAGFEGDTGGFDDFPDEELLALTTEQEIVAEVPQGAAATCPICSESLADVTDHEASVHVNACLDGKPSPLPKRTQVLEPEADLKLEKARPRFQRPAKPGQENPIMLSSAAANHKSAFSALMSNHAEDAAWATAAAAEHASRGKPAFQRTCPFYKIMPGMYICVDAFRYGGVKDCRAYFLSHFHSDHYIGLTSSWSHGPIYCSHVTANLVRQQLRVDPKYVVDLDFEQKTEVPGTSVSVTMISANHCPGSSLFLFEKVINASKTQRILHCGDFRACQAHVEHPLLKPEVVNSITGKTAQQKIDVCYLDTTYLNPKYAFPSQEDVIKACADMCVSLNKVRADETDGWEQMKRDRAGAGMVKFVSKEPAIKQEDAEDVEEIKPEPSELDAMGVNVSPGKARGRLLVVVGTYSIGKERICLGIAEALNSKIYAPPSKQRICACLEDPRLNARLTKNPRLAQVHMTPLFEIRADTLDDYLKDYRDVFSRAVGFRPTGWSYRPPNSRFTESPAVQTVLKSQNWRSTYAMKDLLPQRGSTSRASCFGVPYSEHSSFRELTMFCCALRIDKVVPTVNVGNAKSRERMKQWVERWTVDRKKNGLFKPGTEGCEW